MQNLWGLPTVPTPASTNTGYAIQGTKCPAAAHTRLKSSGPQPSPLLSVLSAVISSGLSRPQPTPLSAAAALLGPSFNIRRRSDGPSGRQSSRITWRVRGGTTWCPFPVGWWPGRELPGAAGGSIEWEHRWRLVSGVRLRDAWHVTGGPCRPAGLPGWSVPSASSPWGRELGESAGEAVGSKAAWCAGGGGVTCYTTISGIKVQHGYYKNSNGQLRTNAEKAWPLRR